ncbi:MAG: DNA recombination/repair protein RecA, partial [Selenomonas sp.]|nr:DNA recombination/repair protein RecA [Selenomonas sp.]
LHARLMSQAMRKLTGVINKSQTVAIFINQIREKVGVTYGNPEVTTGGRALKFYSSVRMEVRKGEKITQGADLVGNRTKVKIVKNKIAPPFKTAEFDIMFGEGVSRLGTLIDIGVSLDIVEKSGSWFSYEGTRLGQGKEKAKQVLEEQPQLAEEIEAKVRAKLMNDSEAAAKAVPADDEAAEAIDSDEV